MSQKEEVIFPVHLDRIQGIQVLDGSLQIRQKDNSNYYERSKIKNIQATRIDLYFKGIEEEGTQLVPALSMISW